MKNIINLLLIGLLLTSCAGRKKQGEKDDRPNFLVILTDDQSWIHSGAYGCDFINTPSFDRLAEEGIRFTNAYVSSPSCGPSRGSLLTGQPFFRLKWASMNHTRWPDQQPTYVDILQESGYHVGATGKGWAPGDWRVSDRTFPPAGPVYSSFTTEPPAKYISNNDYARNFQDFLDSDSTGKPFCFWVGFHEPHRPYEEGSGIRLGKTTGGVDVPPFYPDVEVIRSDLLDYAVEIEWVDKQLGQIMEILAERGELDNTCIIFSSDNGMPFPRAKATDYDMGTRVPLAIRYEKLAQKGVISEEMVSLTDIAPTILEMAGIEIPSFMTGLSMSDLLFQQDDPTLQKERLSVVTGVERHFPGSREGSNCYPVRAIRTREYLYIKNYEPDRYPVGDPDGKVWPADDPTHGFGDVDGSPTKTYLVEHKSTYPELYRLSFGKRPAEELYHIPSDPFQMHNLAGDSAYADVLKQLSERLEGELAFDEDPRSRGNGEVFEEYAKEYPGESGN